MIWSSNLTSRKAMKVKTTRTATLPLMRTNTREERLQCRLREGCNCRPSIRHQ